ncbi:serine O-acetyltransferase [Burkholderia guangdongensis]|uniref:serine O-acetyltransferase n=1 Tax=Burkholderia guangdongensis TaxID=1792500 RepID=UPI0015CE6B81|nr:DapH/DapD/GlmU-related protein [Burkholderia guangdongensis]
MTVTLRATVAAMVEDCRRNAFVKPICVMLAYRIAHYLARRSRITRVLGAPLIALYVFVADWIMGIDIPPGTRIGEGFTLYHGTGTVINGYCAIGARCVMRHGVTIGNLLRDDGTTSGVPSIGDDVEFGAHCIVLGEVRIGDRARIGAGAVVLRDVPDDGVAVGVPATVSIKRRSSA